MEKALMCWSSGKDSAQALYEVFCDRRYEVVALVTSVYEESNRVCLHGVSLELVQAQAQEIGLPLEVIRVPSSFDNQNYEKALAKLHLFYKEQGVTTVIFGDILLEDLRKRREQNLGRVGMQAHFPLWGRNTAELSRLFCARGFKAYLCAASEQYFSFEKMGALLDEKFFSELPEGVDPCGENGEFHSFVFAGPLFGKAIVVSPALECTAANNMLFRDVKLA